MKRQRQQDCNHPRVPKSHDGIIVSQARNMDNHNSPYLLCKDVQCRWLAQTPFLGVGDFPEGLAGAANSSDK
jgi:hypothetical protein